MKPSDDCAESRHSYDSWPRTLYAGSWNETFRCGVRRSTVCAAPAEIVSVVAIGDSAEAGEASGAHGVCLGFPCGVV